MKINKKIILYSILIIPYVMTFAFGVLSEKNLLKPIISRSDGVILFFLIPMGIIYYIVNPIFMSVIFKLWKKNISWKKYAIIIIVNLLTYAFFLSQIEEMNFGSGNLSDQIYSFLLFFAMLPFIITFFLSMYSKIFNKSISVNFIYFHIPILIYFLLFFIQFCDCIILGP